LITFFSLLFMLTRRDRLGVWQMLGNARPRKRMIDGRPLIKKSVRSSERLFGGGYGEAAADGICIALAVASYLNQ
jgi:hypothetical protein